MSDSFQQSVNNEYLKKEAIRTIHAVFWKNKELPSITLPGFLRREIYRKIKEKMEHGAHMNVVEPLQYRYSKWEISEEEEKLFGENTYKAWLSEIIGKEVKDGRGQAVHTTALYGTTGLTGR